MPNDLDTVERAVALYRDLQRVSGELRGLKPQLDALFPEFSRLAPAVQTYMLDILEVDEFLGDCLEHMDRRLTVLQGRVRDQATQETGAEIPQTTGEMARARG